MKKTLLTSSCFLALAVTMLGQTAPAPAVTAAPPPIVATPAAPAAVTAPTIAPVAATPVLTTPPVTTATTAPAVVATPAADNDDDFDRAIEKKINKHFKFDFNGHHHSDDDDMAWMAIPIVFIVFLTIFGLPVAIVGIILYFSFSRSRAMHKTVRMMVEKGQPVPEALLNPPPVIRQRSDLRRGIVLLMVGAGLMVFFGACNDWEGGAWSIGFIPFIIGLGYLLFWRFDVRRDDASPKV
ncbi:MAG TPA: DUF6249 domain-containing protein [Chthoniobacterales bacterium]|jgi:hypothetical protein